MHIMTFMYTIKHMAFVDILRDIASKLVFK